MDYPVWDVAMGGGVLMGLVAVAHVVVSHFAIGGGLLIVASETLAARRGDAALRDLARGSSLLLILVSTVFGAISGVGIWVVAGLIAPGAISALIHEFVWGWAIEWTFFVVEIVAALLYYTTWGRITRRAHLAIGWLYAVAAYLSLVVINGIITFMLTPGRWLATGAFWDGFFNPTYWPSLLLRTGICLLLAAAFMLFVALRAAPAERPRLVRYLAAWLAAGAVVSAVGYRWWEGVLPPSIHDLFRGGEPLLANLAATRSLAVWSLAAVLVLTVVLLVRRLPVPLRVGAAVGATVAAMTFFAGYERLREGVRKPFLIHGTMFSNGLAVADLTADRGPALEARTGWLRVRAGEDPTPQVLGREIFRVQCASCHTVDGYLGIRRRLPAADALLAVAADQPPGAGETVFRQRCASCHPDVGFADMHEMVPAADELRDDPELGCDLDRMMITAMLESLRDQGSVYAAAAPGTAVDPRSLPYRTMPPLVASDDELEALAVYLLALGHSSVPGGA